MRFSLQRGMIPKEREKGAGIKSQPLAQFSTTQSGRRLFDQLDNGVSQVAMLAKADVAVAPQTVGIELGHLWQGVIPAIVVVAVDCSPGLEASMDGSW